MKATDGIVHVGGVGTGRIFQKAHLRAYPPLWRKARMVGFYDIDPGRSQTALHLYTNMLQEYAREHPQATAEIQKNIAELACHDSLDALCEKVDLVDICTHSRGRMPTAIAAFRHGVHAMAEKPMARTWTEADRAVRALAAANGVRFHLNDDNFYELKYRAMRSLVESGAIGKVSSITLMRGSSVATCAALKAQATALENGGGCLMDYGTHAMAGALGILGPGYRPVKVDAVSISVLFPHRVLEEEPFLMEVDDNARIRVLTENAQTGAWAEIFLEATWSGGHIALAKEKPTGQSEGYVLVTGEKGVIETADPDHVYVKTWNGGVEDIPLKHYPGETIAHATEIEMFIDALRGGGSTETDIQFGSDIIAVCGAAYLSALRHRAVTLEEFKQFSRGFVERLGDGPEADDAIVLELLKPYRKGGRA